jgi:exodeoxyribonuclease VII large subunit
MDEFNLEATPQTAISVTELNRTVRTLIERGVGRVWVEGEMSNLARPASGHLYFSLKDDKAQVRCAWFRQRQRSPTINLKNGDKMLAFGKVSLYEPRGDYQLIVERLEAAGEGELRRKFEALKQKLAAEGLFDEALKKPLPTLPRCIGVITSPSGAAIRDVLSVLQRRFPAIPVIIYPVAVQGDAAAPEICAALLQASRRAECDVLIVGRGGGSLEDLWAFNEEAVARAIHDCPLPIISAVGHEVDFTIADLVADYRAPTPSGAAEIVVPDQQEWQRHFAVTLKRFSTQIQRLLEDHYQSLDWLTRRLRQSSPHATLVRQSEQLQRLRKALAIAMRGNLMQRGHAVERMESRLRQQSPAAHLQKIALRLTSLQQRLQTGAETSIGAMKNRLALSSRALQTISPLATLERGYAIVSDANGRAITDASTLSKGSIIETRLAKGQFEAVVSKTDTAKQTD